MFIILSLYYIIIKEMVNNINENFKLLYGILCSIEETYTTPPPN
jgi:hypothetical protein